MLITRVISYGTDILLVFLAVYLFSFYVDIFFIRKKGKTVLIRRCEFFSVNSDLL